jgi:outer membrane protein assembly factor BamB
MIPPAVIPTVLVAGPLALLALLFPALCGGLMLFCRRWLALLVVLSLNSTLYLVHAWLYAALRPSWWGSEPALWTTMTLVTLAGAVWAWRRYRTVKEDSARAGPSRGELVLLWVLALTGLGSVAYGWLRQQPFLAAGHRSLLVIGIGAGAGLLYVLLPQLSGKRLRSRRILTTEGVVLGAMGLCAMVIPATTWLSQAAASRAVRVAWTFVAPGDGWIASSPPVAGDRVFTAVAHHGALAAYGALYCLDRHTGELLWTFDDGGGMKKVYSSPCVADGRLYIGEGFHHDSLCKLYCLDATTGHKLWDFQTKGHTESSPCVAGGRVYFGAGDDGLYCLDAPTGQPLWHFEGPHVDARPAVAGNRVYAGSGYGSYEVFCLDGDTGSPVWRVPVGLPAFGSPTVAGEYVFFGLGTGDLLTSAGTPSGALLCLEARSGERVWRYAVPDAVHTRPVVQGGAVYFTCRDHHCYCLDRSTGRLRWRQDLGSPVVTAPVLAGESHDGTKARLYVVASAGSVWCLDPGTGLPHWSFDVTGGAWAQPPIVSSPAVVIDPSVQGRRCRLYFGATRSQFVSTPALYCLEEALDGPPSQRRE